MNEPSSRSLFIYLHFHQRPAGAHLTKGGQQTVCADPTTSAAEPPGYVFYYVSQAS